MNSWRRCVPVNELSSSNGFSPGSKPSIKEPLIKQKAVCLAQPRSLLQQSIWKGHNTLLSSLTLIPVLCLPASGKGVLYMCMLVPVHEEDSWLWYFIFMEFLIQVPLQSSHWAQPFWLESSAGKHVDLQWRHKLLSGKMPVSHGGCLCREA